MKNPFNIGDKKHHSKSISKQDIASFESGLVHEVCSTFALAREAEWAGRLFVLEMKEQDEEGIGTSVTVNHISPALPGELLEIEAIVKSFEKNHLICTYIAKVGSRLVAQGETGQKILKKSKLEALFKSLEQTNG